ncbi:rho GTPase-activating protein REN1-like [Humulus lupulus]|uniref:rho GTPase-activating protein REN1-like n=1 Tax=Humulus lupulus TaxID=3486 RepID=UPI002B417009|nr:rho GTPase-activating protein REN1-like [Humulus lupulus]
MTTRIPETAQGDYCVPLGGGGVAAPTPPPLPSPAEQLRTRVCNTVFKSGPLFISSKGIGWTSWKKRWFILTRTSLVFFRSDPSAVPQKGSEVNLTLGGIDLNNSGSVVVKADKKLLTVLFPDGRDGRAFTLKAETSEDLNEWKTALESALAQAPTSAAHATGQNGIFRSDQIDSVDGSLDQSTDRQSVKSSVIGRPILLALEDADGTPSFLEKALQFIEEHGVKVEGILRQAADVDDVEHRVREYEQGKNEFSSGEDAHIVADCIKHVLRELPSSPVPASCCNALLQACRTDRCLRVNAMRAALCDAFPEPNRRLLQRILVMMRNVASHKDVNRMSCSAVAACMAPLLLRPLLAGDCEIENDFDVGGDGSIQLLQAAAAANHAQAIVITLLDEYDKIFGEDSMTPEPNTESEESGSESGEATDDDESYEDDENDDATQESDDDPENASSEMCSESGDSGDSVLHNDKVISNFLIYHLQQIIQRCKRIRMDIITLLSLYIYTRCQQCASCLECPDSDSGPDSPEVGDDSKPKQNLVTSFCETSPSQSIVQCNANDLTENSYSSVVMANDPGEVVRDISSGMSLAQTSIATSWSQISTTISSVPERGGRNRTSWGRTSGRKNLSMESINYGTEDEVEVQRLEVTKSELEHRIAEEVNQNAVLKINLERRKTNLTQHRLALEQDVARLQEQLQKERDLRLVLEAGLKMSHGPLPYLATIDEKTKAELEEIAKAEADVVNLKQKLDDLGMQLNQQRELHHGSIPNVCNLTQNNQDFQTKLKEKQKDTEVVAPSNFERSRNKEAHLGATENENERTVDSSSLTNKQAQQNQQQREISSTNYRSVGVSADPSPAELFAAKRYTLPNSKRIGTKGEGVNSTTSALSKLTTRLNFLKERRSQIATELQNMDKGRGSSQTVQNPVKGRKMPHNNPEKGQRSDVQGNPNPEKGIDLDNPELFQNLVTEGQSLESPVKIKKAESHVPNYTDRAK